MRVEKVGYFVQVARCGSLRQAAARAGIAQSSLAQQLTGLEEELDLQLIERSRRGVTLTTAGEALLPYAIRLVDAQRDLVDAAVAYSTGAISGSVRIGTTPMATTLAVIPVISRLRREYPRLRIAISEGSSAHLEQLVLAGEIDFALVTTSLPVRTKGVTRRPLLSVPLGVYVRRDDPLALRRSITWDDLAPLPLVSMNEGTTLWAVLHARLVEPRSDAQVASLYHLMLMVDQGIGVGIGIRVTPPADAEIVWIPIDGESEGLKVQLSTRESSLLTRSARVVYDALAKHVQELQP